MRNLFQESDLIPRLDKSRLTTLTNREWQVLLLLSGNMTNQEIADHMNITRKTVSIYRTNIASKLDASGKENLSRMARAHRVLIIDTYNKLYQAQLPE